MPYTVSLINAHPGGMKPRVYFLELTWTDSTDPNAVSVNVYRSTVSGGPYTLVGNVPIGVQLFDDLGVVPQTTYFYVLTAVNSQGAEGARSLEQSGTPGWIP